MRRIILGLLVIASLSASAQETITTSSVATAEKMFGISFSEAKRDSMLGALSSNLKVYNYIHSKNIPNDAPYPLWYNPVLPTMVVPKKQMPVHFTIPELSLIHI